MPNNNLEKNLWDAADELRANSKLRAADYSIPILGLIFLKYADHKFAHATAQFQAQAKGPAQRRRRRDPLSPDRYKAAGVLYLPDDARFEHLVKLPEGENIGHQINAAMTAIEEHNETLKDILPKTYVRFENATLRELVRIFNRILMDIEGDVFGKVYEYFLGKFAMAEGQKGGEFFTPTAIVKLIVEVIEPYKGYILDPACGSGGMFVQSARFVQRHQGRTDAVSIYGQERVNDTVRLCEMNLAVHGIEGDVRQGNSYYDLAPRPTGSAFSGFDFVMANPPFNVDRVDKDRIKNDRARYPYSMPRVDNANYLWIQLFHSALNPSGRAGFVMANSASDARSSELDICQQLIQSGIVDVMIAIDSNFFYTVTLPCTLWFLDLGKPQDRRHQTLFLDARRTFTQVDRAHREFTPAQVEFLANIVRLYRGREIETAQGSADLMVEHFPDGIYQDVPGLCKVAAQDEIEAQGWSLNPGRYVGVPEREEDPDFDFATVLTTLHEELETLNTEAHGLEERIAGNVTQLLGSLQ
ncbi:MAG: SAM-dependent DNA methyltransferase [Proteobacteria bacterium]|nr:SAM-dependent DNA methyltransferase [Pseudomonadota bacterium]